MKITHARPFLFLFFVLFCTSCDKKDAIELIDPSFQTLELSCGGLFEVPVSATDWRIEFVEEIPSHKKMVGEDLAFLALEGEGRVEASNGWLTLSRNKEDRFVVDLKENFDRSNARTFMICINAAGDRAYVTITQRAGSGYELVESSFEEIAATRKIYLSDRGCSTLTLTNLSSKAEWQPFESIFKEVVELSSFESTDYGAFAWMPAEGMQLSVPDLEINHAIYWTNRVDYAKGTTTLPFVKEVENGSKFLVQPYSTLQVSGKVRYCERSYRYTLTIRNSETGTLFEIHGTWKQVLPFMKEVTSS